LKKNGGNPKKNGGEPKLYVSAEQLAKEHQVYVGSKSDSGQPSLDSAFHAVRYGVP
jgi:hypothetical protein